VYLTSEAEVATWTARVGDAGDPEDLRLFVHQGGEGVATDSQGNVYLAAGDVFVYDPSGALVDTVPVPSRPTQVVFGGPTGAPCSSPPGTRSTRSAPAGPAAEAGQAGRRILCARGGPTDTLATRLGGAAARRERQKGNPWSCWTGSS
jgi:hypothetical protein